MKRLAIVLILLPLTALATDNPPSPPAPQPAPTAVAGATAAAGARSTSESTSTSTSGAYSGGSVVSVSSAYEDRLQAPSSSAPSVYPSGVCGSGGSFGLSIPGGAVTGSKATKEIQGCERREWFRLLAVAHPALALRIACSDPIVAAVAKPADCEYTQPVVAVPPAPVTPPVDLSAYATREEVIERDQRLFKSVVGK